MRCSPTRRPPPDVVARDFARALGTRYYLSSVPPRVAVSSPRPMRVDGVTGSLVEATSRVAVDDVCLATEGALLVLALPVTGPSGTSAVALFVVNGDVTGGPADPPAPSRETLESILASVHLSGG